MRGASARSQERVVHKVDQVVDDGADAPSLGEELFAVVRVLDEQPVLRRLLTDPGAPEQAKRGMVDQLFGTGGKGRLRRLLSPGAGAKVADATLDTLGEATTQRWQSTRDLGDALERAGITAYLAAAQRQGQLDEVEDELFRFARVVHGDPELRAAVGNRSLPPARRRDLVGRLLEGRAQVATVALAQQASAVRNGSFETTMADLGQLAARRRQRLVATVTSAVELTEQERDRLAQALGRHYGQGLHLNVIVDQTVLGGLAVQVGDDLINGTVSARLADARRRLTG